MLNIPCYSGLGTGVLHWMLSHADNEVSPTEEMIHIIARKRNIILKQYHKRESGVGYSRGHILYQTHEHVILIL